jgi:hypothetical protein
VHQIASPVSIRRLADSARLSDKILVALRLAAAGVGIRDAAAAAGYAHHAELSRKFCEFGFSPLDRATMGKSSRGSSG